MYYVVFVGTGNEERMEQLIRKTISDKFFCRCFHPTKHMKKKIHGEWIHIYEKLIPGYIFVESEDISAFYNEIKRLQGVHILLGKSITKKQPIDEKSEGISENAFKPLSKEEECWLKKMSGLSFNSNNPQENPVVGLTQISFNENDQIYIVSGPLKDFSGQIKKINLHKRTAEVDVEFMGQSIIALVGIEIIKRENRQKEENDEF